MNRSHRRHCIGVLRCSSYQSCNRRVALNGIPSDRTRYTTRSRGRAASLLPAASVYASCHLHRCRQCFSPARGVPWPLILSDVTKSAIHEAAPLLRSFGGQGDSMYSVAFRYNLQTIAVARLPHIESGYRQSKVVLIDILDEAVVSTR